MNNHQKFQESSFNEKLKSITEKIDSLNTDCTQDNETKRLLLRIKKVFHYIDEYINIIDWDLVTATQITNLIQSATYLDKIQDNINSVKSEISEKPPEESIRQINNLLDNHILPNIQQVLVKAILPKKINLKSVYQEYNETLNNLLNEINVSDLQEEKQEIKTYYDKLFTETEDEHSIKSEIDEKFNDIKNKYKEIEDYYEQLLNGNEENSNSIKQKIQDEKNTIDYEIEEIRNKIEESSNKQDELNKFYIKIFGSLDEEDQRINGLEQRLDKDLKNLDNYKEIQEKAIEKIKNEIKSHMPNAASVGLATAFNREVVKLRKSVWVWTGTFILSLVIVAVYIIYFAQINYLDWFNLLKSVSFTSVLISIAVFCGIRRSENNRLYHEYLHKEVSANSFSSYKKQIEELNEENSTLLASLLEKTVETMSYNPSMTLDKKHSSNLPVAEIIKGVSNTSKK